MDIKLPPLGEGVDSGTVVSLLVNAGDAITRGQGILEIETGKAVAAVPAPVAGKAVKWLVSVGDKVGVGQSLLSIAESSDASPAPQPVPKAAPTRTVIPAPVAPEPEPAEPAQPSLEIPAEEPEPPGGLPIAASPALRRIARELGINLRKIHGSERGGRIVMADLRAYIARLERLAFTPRTAPKPGAPAPAPSIDFSKWGPVTQKPLTQLRKVIAQHMSDSWRSVPRVTQFDEADITVLNDLRKKYADAFDKKGARLTLTSFALKVIAGALKKFPIFNSSLDETTEEIVLKDYIHIGLAVDTEQGLIVPVIRDADKKDLVQLSMDINSLAEKARDRKISMDELLGGTFTLSNQGGIGGGHFTPIVNKPEAAILGLGRGALKPVIVGGKIEPRLMLPMAVSYDHRIIDGGTAARFTLELKQGFENFSEALLK